MPEPQKPSILYIITQGSWGGAQRYVFDLATNLADELDITVAVGEPNGKKDLQEKLQVKGQRSKVQVIQLKHLVRRISPFHDLLALFELKKLYKKINPDIVHLNSSKAGIIGSIASWLRITGYGLLVYTVHGWVFTEPLGRLKTFLCRKLEQWTARLKDRIIVLSEHDGTIAKQVLYIPEKKLALTPLGFQATPLLSKEAAREALQSMAKNPIPNSAIWIGTIAGLYKTKGIDILIQAIHNLNFQFPVSSFQFLIIGDGPEKNNLGLLVSGYGLPNIHFLGYQEDASQYLNVFDLFVLPSRKEGFPYTILEAINAGVPIVATRVGAVPERIKHKKTGLLVEPGNAAALSEQLADACAHPEAMQRYAAEAIKNTEQSLSQMITNTKHVYSSNSK